MPWPVPNRPPCSTASSTPRTDSTTPARRTAPTEATLGPAGTPRPENPTPRQPTIHTHQRNEDPETPRYRPLGGRPGRPGLTSNASRPDVEVARSGPPVRGGRGGGTAPR